MASVSQPFASWSRCQHRVARRLDPRESTAKCWMGMSFDGELRVWTYSWEALIDLDTGKIIEAVFTK